MPAPAPASHNQACVRDVEASQRVLAGRVQGQPRSLNPPENQIGKINHFIQKQRVEANEQARKGLDKSQQFIRLQVRVLVKCTIFCKLSFGV
jgi:hypothetical protein